MAEFEQVKAALSRFIFTDEGLWLSDLLCNINLAQPSIKSNLAEKREESFAVGYEFALCHVIIVEALDVYAKIGYAVSKALETVLVVAMVEPSQLLLFDGAQTRSVQPFRPQLLKWVGNKQRFAHEIISYFPVEFSTYFEPFLGSGAVLGTLAPERSIGSDVFKPLVEIWQTLRNAPEILECWYAERWHAMMNGDKVEEYERIKAAYNANPNAADLLFLCRSCYGGVVRFRQADGYISTPCGIHTPISPEAFSRRVDIWHRRTAGTEFLLMDYEEAMELAKPFDIVYCDPPYGHSQSILYGAQSFDLEHLLQVIDRCKSRGVYVALSLEGTKRSGDLMCDVPIPDGLFEHEVFVNVGRSMLKRFQMNGQTLEDEVVADRLLLTF